MRGSVAVGLLLSGVILQWIFSFHADREGKVELNVRMEYLEKQIAVIKSQAIRQDRDSNRTYTRNTLSMPKSWENGSLYRRSKSIHDYVQNYVSGHHHRHSKPLAIFTYVRTEPVFLPLFLKHYAAHVDPWDIFVLDNDSTDNSSLIIPNHVITIHNDFYFDHSWLIKQVRTFTDILLKQGYRRVLFGDVDELVLPHPKKYPGGLLEYVSKLSEAIDVVRVTAYNLVQNTTIEPGEIDLMRPILKQRTQWKKIALYNKPLLVRRSVRWGKGFHNCVECVRIAPDPDLVMIHLHYFDENFNKQRVVWKLQQKIHMGDARSGAGVGSLYLKGDKIVVDMGKIAREYRDSIQGSVKVPHAFLNPPVM